MLKIALPRTWNYVLGAFIFAFSAYALINKEFYLGITSLLLTTGTATTYNYIALDFAAGYKGDFTCLFGLIPLGGWERLPAINHVFLKHFSEIAKDEISDSGVYQTLKRQRYLVMFSVPNSSVGWLLLEVQNVHKARAIAKDIATAGALELKDYTC
ncbi:hypothetical protein Q5H92_17555 [Hymenobacter sp. M29]|uniref:Uncharacterized protein n=1 Tax=Hymenobacter mellowenesis TaxID=3063995 RepID=A0ABT9AFP6_9BACT|nr:hypothetical protein [Hymenobacter sp. M29]MDO7848177.1 hypothetical protein [Hymenobacter sp. M29]